MTYSSIASNSSRLRCLDKNAAARFFTRRASRLLSPVTSGGIQSLVLTGPDGAARVRFRGGGVGEEVSLVSYFSADGGGLSGCEPRFRDTVSKCGAVVWGGGEG